MSGPAILITAAAGNTGFPAALRLLDSGFRVRALVRRMSPRTEQLRDAGAEMVTGSMDDIADLRRALAGMDRAYFCPPLLPGLLDKTALFAAAAQESGLEFAVLMSQWLADPAHPSIHTRQTWMAEQVFRGMGEAAAIVNPGWFADNYLAAPELITQFGVLPMPLGQGRNAPPSNEDIGRVVAAILADPSGHAGTTCRPTGPELLTPDRIAAALASATGRRVRYIDAPIGMFGKIGRSLGLPDYTVAQVLHYLADYQRDAFAAGAPTTVVADITGQRAEDMETIARRYLAPRGRSRRTAGTIAAALAKMTAGLLRGVPNLKVISRTGDFAIPNGSLAADSPAWRETHARPVTPAPALS